MGDTTAGLCCIGGIVLFLGSWLIYRVVIRRFDRFTDKRD